MKMTSRVETTLAIAAAGLVIVGCWVVLRPFTSSVLWAMVLCYCTWPLYTRLVGWFRQRRSLAALVMTVVIGTILVAPFIIVGITLAENVPRLDTFFRSLQDGTPPEPPAWVREAPWVGSSLEQAWRDFAQDTETFLANVKAVAGKAAEWLLKHSVDFGKGVGQLALSVVILFFLYRDGKEMTERIVAGGQRIMGDAAQQYVTVVGRTVRGVVFGIIGTGMAQGILAAIGFWIAGVPSAFLLGLLVLVLSIVPVGPPLVWGAASIWLFRDGQTGWGIFMVIWGALAISGIDNLLKPYFISAGSKLPFIMTLLGAIGGVLTFGFIGIFLGPVLLAIGYSLVKEFTAVPRRRDA
jgi:predicted PurR-regulated permease PerM